MHLTTEAIPWNVLSQPTYRMSNSSTKGTGSQAGKRRHVSPARELGYIAQAKRALLTGSGTPTLAIIDPFTRKCLIDKWIPSLSGSERSAL
jgi:hypothetical protein